jgi:hypothetical protein
VRRRAAAALCRRLHHVSCRRPGRPAPPLHVHYMPVCLRAAACNLIPYTAYVRADRNHRPLTRAPLLSSEPPYRRERAHGMHARRGPPP